MKCHENPNERRPYETQEEFKIRRRMHQDYCKYYRLGIVVWPATLRVSYVKELYGKMIK